VAILLGNGDGAFQSAKMYTVLADSQPAFVATRDFNQDGRPDLALSTGDNSYTDYSTESVTCGSYAIAVGDFNGDGKLDIAVAHEKCDAGPATVSVLLGKGDGRFQPAVNYPVGGQALSVAVADFNGDGKLDIVAGGSNIRILLGNGDGTFQPATTPISGQFSYLPSPTSAGMENRIWRSRARAQMRLPSGWARAMAPSNRERITPWVSVPSS
jgi:hypothetical protein